MNILKSSPARGTWIEIRDGAKHKHETAGVVPRKGDVDRNHHHLILQCGLSLSSPARGTWIEI